MNAPSAMIHVRRADIGTTDIARTHDLLSRTYVEHEPRLARPGAGFAFHSRTASAADLSIDRLEYRGAVEATADPFDSITAVVVFDGWYSVDEGGHTRRYSGGDAFLVPLGSRLTVAWDHIDLHNVRFALSAATRVAGRLGVAAADFRFDGSTPVSQRMKRHWIAAAGFVTRTFAGTEPAVAHPLVYANAIDTVATAALAVFPNTTMTVAYVAGPGRVPPAVVRRAMAYIDEHAAEPITLEDIAAAARIGIRGLQAAFARQGDTTPMGHLRRVRMTGAHRDLRSGDRSRGDTVAAIAGRWGFTTPGRFSVEYRKIYGRSPGHTLRM
ncbi:AraC family transcriptional regulator [Actinoplanes sp. GCM10030250]|uniref:AraC family transcriptional regulator n=1 Tax=Actinoplanes sp. GCM10030250 TaxID=3273376 RepID=UPI00361B77F2